MHVWISRAMARSHSDTLGRFRQRRLDRWWEGGDRPTSEVSQQSARSEQSGWVVGTSVVCARANDRREAANVRGACVRATSRGACAVRCHDVCVSRGANAFSSRTASRVNSRTWRVIPGARIRDASPSAAAAAVAEEKETVVFVHWRCGVSCCCWSSRCCCWRSSYLLRTPRDKVSLSTCTYECTHEFEAEFSAGFVTSGCH